MQYTEKEIIYLYKATAEKDKQIKVLTELCACERRDIIQILKKHGLCDAKGNEIKNKEKHVEPEVKHSKPTDRLIEMVRMKYYGHSNKDIAFSKGITIGTVVSTFSRHNITRWNAEEWLIKNDPDFKEVIS